jgi:hypothetical protein
VLDIRAQGVFERVGAVAGAVVGQHPFDSDSAGLEVGVGAFPEPSCGFLLFVGEDFGIGQPGVVIDGVVQESIAGSAVRRRPGLVPVTDGSALAPVAAAVRDPPEFLDVHVDQLPGLSVLVATDHPARGPVQPGQPGQPVPGEHPMHRGWMDPQQVTDPRRTPPAVDSDCDDPPFPPWAGLPRRGSGPARNILHAGLTMLPVTAGPP